MTVRYLPQEPDLSGFATTRGLSSRRGSRPGDDRAPRALSAREPRPHRRGGPGAVRAARARRAALARVLAPEPDILLLDEPTNHLDLAGDRVAGGDARRRSRSALVLISHDRRFLREPVARRRVWLDRGARGGSTRASPSSRRGATRSSRQEERDRHKLDRKIVAGGALAALRRHARGASATRAGSSALIARCAASGGRSAGAPPATCKLTVQEARAVRQAGDRGRRRHRKSYGGPPMVRDFSIRIERGDRIGIVGPNGAGKTTLLNLLTGALAPDTGTRQARRQSRDRHARPAAREPRPRDDRSPTR